MSLGDQIAKNLPYLRRYARALTGSQATGDAFVRATLEAALADEDLKASLEGGRVPLYRAFNKVWGSAYMEAPDSGSDFSAHEEAASGRLKVRIGSATAWQSSVSPTVIAPSAATATERSEVATPGAAATRKERPRTKGSSRSTRKPMRVDESPFLSVGL